MSHVAQFGLAVLLASLAGVVAVLSNRLSERLRVPAPAFFLIGAAIASDIWPKLGEVSFHTVERIVTVALAVILFDGGLHSGWRRFRTAAAATVWLGLVGTLVTTGALAAVAHYLFGFDWQVALLLGAALAPTDPAVVFSVLGRREVGGRTGVLLEGESGFNDPVGIALLLSLLTTTGSGTSAAGSVTVGLLAQLAIGAAVGVAGGWLLLQFMRRVPLPNEGLYPLRVLASAMAVYGLATVAGGSGFLAVYIAGILLGDERAPYKREIERFHASLASLAEIVAFTLLGLTIRLYELPDGWVWAIGLAMATLLFFLIRPLLVGLVLLPVRLARGERLFVLLTGLKGAVPILLGTLIIQAGAPGAERIYQIIFVVVTFSVIVQGGLVPWLAHRLGVPLHAVEPEPWSIGVRLRHEPEGLRRFEVARGSPADGMAISELPVGESAWVTMVLRGGRLVSARGSAVLEPGDEVLVVLDREADTNLGAVFQAGPGPTPGQPVQDLDVDDGHGSGVPT
jgi:cell volume regulation protein A